MFKLYSYVSRENGLLSKPWLFKGKQIEPFFDGYSNWRKNASRILIQDTFQQRNYCIFKSHVLPAVNKCFRVISLKFRKSRFSLQPVINELNRCAAQSISTNEHSAISFTHIDMHIDRVKTFSSNDTFELQMIPNSLPIGGWFIEIPDSAVSNRYFVLFHQNYCKKLLQYLPVSKCSHIIQFKE